MKIAVIKTYDMSTYKNKLEEYYNDYNIDHIDTSTEVLPRTLNEQIIWFIAIVFYKEKEV